MLNHEKISEHLEDILDYFDIKYKKYNKRYSFACPIHGGNKKDGVSLFKADNRYCGNWVCWTNHCEKIHGKSTINFIKGCFFSIKGEKKEFNEIKEWLEQLIGENLDIDSPPDWKIKRDSIILSECINQKNKLHVGIPKNLVRSRLQIPSNYFLQRGFSKEILDKYDVGLCLDTNKQMYERVVVPVYNDNGTDMVGCVGRTTCPKCFICNSYHSPHNKCPSSSYDEYRSAKWINSKGFNSEHYLYNFWYAKEYINLYKTVILVEGQGDIWRLEESDIHCGLGLFGTSLTPYQKIKLEKTGATNIIIATDNDPPGIEAKYLISEQLQRYYNIIPISLPAKDLGDLSTDTVKSIFEPILSKFKQ